MADLGAMKEIVNQAAIWVATVMMIALRDMEAGSQLTNAARCREPQRQSAILEKPA